MITAIDTSVLLDVLAASSPFGQASLAALTDASFEGSLMVCPIVWAEVRPFFQRADTMGRLLDQAGIRFDPFDQQVSDLAGAMWRKYRRRGGKRTHRIADFLVGAHAQIRANRLLTRDRGFYRRYFSRLTVVEP